MRWTTEIASDARYALRTWAREPAFVAVAVLSLAAGIGLNTAVFAIVNTIFLQSVRGVPQPDRVVSVGSRVPFATFRHVRDNSRTLAGVAAWQPLGVEIRAGDVAMRRAIPIVTENYFAVLGVLPARGRLFDPVLAQQPRAEAVAVLDHEFWTGTLGADPAVIGQTIAINRVPATIIGVAPLAFHGIGPERPPLWIPIGMKPAVTATAARWDDPAENGWRIIGRLAAGGTLDQVNAEMRMIAGQSAALFPDGPLAGATASERWPRAMTPEKQVEFLLVVVLPLVVVGLMLWIGCSNVANLLLARAATRRREIAIRIASGASRGRVVRMLLTESIMLAAAGAAVGALLSSWTLDFVWMTFPEFSRLAVELDATVAAYTTVVCLFATLLFGLVPALHATRVELTPMLKTESAVGDARRSARLRVFLLVTQFASSVALLVVAATFVRTVVTTHVGEQADHIDHVSVASVETTNPTPAGRREYWARVRDDLRRVPQVTALTLTNAGGTRRMRAAAEGSSQTADGTEVAVQAIDDGFLRINGAVLVAGRANLADGAAGVEPVLVNERAAHHYWGTTSVVSKRLVVAGGAPLEVIGVVRDSANEPRVFRRQLDEEITAATIMIRTSQPAEMMRDTLRAVLTRLSPDWPFTTVSTFREAGLGGLQRLTRMALVVSGLALALACVGLYGSVSFITAQRTREIAIRVAIGAPRLAVVGLLTREAVAIVAAGSLCGLALMAFAMRFMAGMIFVGWNLDPLTVIGVLTTLAGATGAACYIPGRRALRIEPAAALRRD